MSNFELLIYNGLAASILVFLYCCYLFWVEVLVIKKHRKNFKEYQKEKRKFKGFS